VGIGLVTKTFKGLHEILPGVVDRKNDGDESVLGNSMSHSDIYRIVRGYPFVKYYRGKDIIYAYRVKKGPDGLGRGLAKEEEPLDVVYFFILVL